MGSPDEGRQAERPRRGQRPLLAAGLLLVGLGVLILVQAARLHGRPPTGPDAAVAPGLERAERIEAAFGALSGWNLLVVTLDTTRADRLGVYGNTAIETPVVDGLAHEGVLFADAVTPVPATLPAHSSLMTGLYPPRHGVRANGTFRLEPAQLTLAEILEEHGYRNAAAVSAYVLDSSYGLDQGFETYLDDLSRGIQHAPQTFRERPAELANEAVSGWLAEHADEPFFLWMHYFDAHAPYLAPEPFRSRYRQDPYAGEIAYADHQLGRLLAELERHGVRERTLVVVTADHGEGLGEHGEFTHSLLLHDATLRVPLVLHAPGALPPGRVIERQASLVDVLPTVLDLLGIEAPAELDGHSFLGELGPAPRPTYVETLATQTLHGWAPLFGVRREDWKYVLAPRPELYDLEVDPAELANLAPEHPELVEELQRELDELAGQDRAREGEVVAGAPLDDVSREALAALGYVITASQSESPREAMDPKDGVRYWERVQGAVAQRNAGKIEAAIETLEAAVEEVPRDVFALQMLAGAYRIQGRSEEALEANQAAEELEQSNPAIPLFAASLHLDRLQLDEAEAAIERARRIEEGHPVVEALRARVAELRGKREEAHRHLRLALALDRGTNRARILNQQADLHLSAGESEDARDAFEAALALDAFNGDVHAGLAEVLWRAGEKEEARRHLAQGLHYQPVQPRALSVRCGMEIAEGRLERAIASCERALEITPVYGPAHANLGLAYRQLDQPERAEEIYRQGIERAPGYPPTYRNLAQLLLRLGREKEAAASFERAALLDPYDSVALANLGVFHLKIGRAESAQQLLERAVEVDPDYAFAHKQLAVLLASHGEETRAREHFARSLELDPTQPDAGAIRFQLDQPIP